MSLFDIKKNPETWLMIIILIFAAVLRLTNYSGFSLSNDELSALFRLQYDTFCDLVDKGFYVDGHPGGIQVFLFYWVKIFGESEASLRFPFVVMGVLAVWFSFLTAKSWFGKTSGLFVAVLIALLQFSILYSQIARPYGSGLFFSMFTAFYWTKLVFFFKADGNKKYIHAVLYTTGTSLMMYNHYFSFLLAFIIGLTGLFFLRKENIWYYLASGVACVILFSPHIYITINHLSIGGVGLWLGKPDFFWLLKHFKYIFNNSAWLLIITIIISLTGFLGRPANENAYSRFRIIALIWFLLPMLTGFFYSKWVNPVIQHSVLIFSFPFLLMFLFSFSFWKTDKLRLFMLGIIAAAAFVTTVVVNRHYSSQHFGEFKDVAAQIVNWDNEYGKENITRAISVNNPFYIEYYLKRHSADPEFVQYDNRGEQDLFELRKILETSATNYFVYAWTKPVPYEVPDLIKFYYPIVLQRVDYAGLSEVVLYARDSNEGMKLPLPDFSLRSSFNPGDLWRMPESSLDSTLTCSGKYSIRISPDIEYEPVFECAAGDIKIEEGATIKINAVILTLEANSKAMLVFSLEQLESPVYIWKSSPVSYYAVPGVWSPVILTFPLEKLISTSDLMKIYFWNPGKETFNIDRINIEVFNPMKNDK